MGTIPRLSVVSFTNAPAPRVAASFARVRDLATEIIVAVDDRVDPDTLGPLHEVADRVVRAEYVTPFEANLAWLDSLVTGDWVLQLDGDDVVSDALLEHLATPGWDSGITHAFVSYRWLWPSANRMLDQGPWWPDPVLRLFRSTPGITSYPGVTHSGRQVVGDHRFIEASLYHLDLLIGSVAEREAKADAYERANPGHRTERGWAVNGTMYLPENRPNQPRTAEVPAADVRAVEAVRCASAGAGAPPPVGPVVTAAERRAPPPGPGELGLRVLDHSPVCVVAGLPARFIIGVTNRSQRPWRLLDAPPTLVGARLRTPQGDLIGGELRAALSGPVLPGEEALIWLTLPGTLPLGRLVLQVGALQEHVAWYDNSIEVEVEVQLGRRVVVVSAADASAQERVRDLLVVLARRLPDVVPSVVVASETAATLDTDLPTVDARVDADPELLVSLLDEVLPTPPRLS